ncbi:hypothetical protein HCH_05207 [Hahella chejuensis KCTC 2396]|uniref:Uncharacterized protein n=1 Tax=Hahella chejuensis (strain KCTC 2396) TaxID=349521 RepID=Q2SBU1_HAHCH|nr:hypothetical protein HCH_05207 [Hahella chejuensis KCTC 2396]
MQVARKYRKRSTGIRNFLTTGINRPFKNRILDNNKKVQ